MPKKILIIFGILLAFAMVTGVFIFGFFIGSVFPSDNTPTISLGASSKDLRVVDEVFDIVRDQFVEKESKRKLQDGAIDGILKALDDPYTRRLKGEHFKTLEEQTNGKFSGVGIEISTEDGKLIVVAPIKNTPASKAGVQAKDLILKIDGKSTEDMDIQEAVKLIRGKEGSKVVLTFARNGGKPFDVEITREEIKVPNVSGEIKDGDIGYINILQFSEGTGDDVDEELISLKEKGAKGIIIDLRSNPGGLLEEAVAVSSSFIKTGEPIVKIKPRTGKSETKLSTGKSADTKTPLVILVDKGSASASEIVAGAIQDIGRGEIIGEKTFGKGSVQSVITLSDGSGLVITTAKYLTPRGRSLSNKGIKPDVVVERDMEAHKSGNDNQLDMALKILRENIDAKNNEKAS